MPCIDPSEMRPGDLLTYVDGEAGPAVSDHVGRCEHCAREVEIYRHMQIDLQPSLYRLDCPDSEVIGEFHLGITSPEVSQSIAAHLKRCPLCSEELQVLRQYMREVDFYPAESPLEKIKVLVAKLISPGDAAGVPFQPAYAGVRGETPTGLQTYEANGITITISVEEDTAQPGRKLLLGFLSTRGQELESLAGAGVQLFREADLIATDMVDDLGNVVFGGILPGEYTLKLMIEELEVRVEGIAI